jgi:holo-[acyl-carrier protein] synthase
MSTLVGIDVQSIEEVAASLTDFGPRYVRRLFTPSEIESCGKNLAMAARRFASCFAAKEAVLKIFDVCDEIPSWKSIAVTHTISRRAEIALTDTAADLARRQGIEKISLAVSHSADFVIATVVAQAVRRPRPGRA